MNKHGIFLLFSLICFIFVGCSVTGDAPKIEENSAALEKVEEYRSYLTMGKEKFIETVNDESVNSVMIQYAYDYGIELAYSLTDVNGDGKEELLITTVNQEGKPESVIDLYSIINDTAVKVFPDNMFGERTMLYILDDGTMLVDGANSAFSSVAELNKIGADGVAETVSGFFFYEENGAGDNGVSEFTGKGLERVSVDEYSKRIDELKKRDIINKLEVTKIS